MLALDEITHKLNSASRKLKRSLSKLSLLVISCFGHSNTVIPDSDFKLVQWVSVQETNSADTQTAVVQYNALVGKLCDYCGYLYHARKLCPARHILCSFCHIPGHYRSVCRQWKRQNPSQPVVSMLAMNNFHTDCPTGLKQSIIPVLLNGSIELSALVDTGSTNTYLDTKIAKRLKLNLVPNLSSVTLASSNSVVKSHNSALVSELSVLGFSHSDLKIATLDGLCCDMIIGHDLLSHHRNLVINFGGNRPDLQIQKGSGGPICNVAAA